MEFGDGEFSAMCALGRALVELAETRPLEAQSVAWALRRTDGGEVAQAFVAGLLAAHSVESGTIEFAGAVRRGRVQGRKGSC